MGKSIAIICIEHPEVRKKVEQMGEVIGKNELDELLDMPSSSDDLMYCPVALCEEGSTMHNQLKNNGWRYNGLPYDVIKDVSFEKK